MNENQLQEQEPETPIQAPEQKPKEVKPKKQPVEKSKYDKYIGLKFLQISGAKLTDETSKEIEQLEKELKACSGKPALRTVTAAISSEIVKMVEGVPLPDEYLEVIKGSKDPGYYV